MTTAQSIILLFEDTEANARQIEQFLDPKLSNKFKLAIFATDKPVTEASFVQRLKDELGRYGDISLIVSDMDLSKTQGYKGLTDAIITRVAHDLGIPTAYYSTALAAQEGHRQDQAGDGRILLGAAEYPLIAHRISVLAEGFAEIKQKIVEILKMPPAQRPQSAAEFVAELIGRKETFQRVGLYVSGDQRIGAEILSSPKDRGASRQAMIFGTWIFDSLMRYPGVFVNRTAAASYLNINPEQFSSHEIFSLWTDALYSGPFADQESPLFWRDKLDRMLSSAGADDGREYVIGKEIFAEPCYCSVDPTVEAGYFCMVTEKPVSYENSVGNVSWFPPGADLARISVPKYEELAPWLSA
ncbi:hypothetical protein [Paraburkholderia largidicola]|uniref:Uncharacterized protein n=1 Tax=Paraburkholderia largidicola TaxID=3014751 RepID=A0A7I8C1P0_9BURK|nr:hypothetical protein [Paraburkholderia sp. PGU16]BCF94942.1 hypothetical protein PPGU16_80090 [Paraburkholderia sp. PGU16]